MIARYPWPLRVYLAVASGLFFGILSVSVAVWMVSAMPRVLAFVPVFPVI